MILHALVYLLGFATGASVVLASVVGAMIAERRS